MKKQWAAEIKPLPTAFFIRSSAFSSPSAIADNRLALWYHTRRPEIEITRRAVVTIHRECHPGIYRQECE